MKTQTMTVQEAVKAITQHRPDRDTRITRRIEVGSMERQGDVYVNAVPADWPRGKERGSRKVAVGEGVGSNHVAEGEGVKVYEGVKGPVGWQAPGHVEDAEAWEKEMLGPVVVAEGPWTLTHPTHAHHQLPAGTYQCTYQADELTGKKVRD